MRIVLFALCALVGEVSAAWAVSIGQTSRAIVVVDTGESSQRLFESWGVGIEGGSKDSVFPVAVRQAEARNLLSGWSAAASTDQPVIAKTGVTAFTFVGPALSARGDEDGLSAKASASLPIPAAIYSLVSALVVLFAADAHRRRRTNV